MTKKIFLVDALGAFLSFVLLGFVFINLHGIFNIPKQVLISLASIAFIFANYSFICYFFIEHELRFFLKIIAFLNTGYCIITASLCIYYLENLTKFEKIYFPFEIVFILGLAFYELKIAKNNS